MTIVFASLHDLHLFRIKRDMFIFQNSQDRCVVFLETNKPADVRGAILKVKLCLVGEMSFGFLKLTP